MKKFIYLFVVVISLSSCMTFSTLTYEQPFSRVYEFEGKTKNKLFLDANNWMVSTFGNAESVIEYSDKEEGAIIGKYLLHGRLTTGTYGNDTRIFAKIDIRVKDNKAKIEIKPNDWTYDASGMTIYNYSKEDATKDIEALAQNFYESLSQATNTEW